MAILEAYRGKRDFDITPEPAPAERPRAEQPLTFVVQKHAARRLHYDFRLELDGVLKSWAVPKGPSLNPADKRLAVMVEDHPMDYASFEGVIPKGQYGAGQVIVWDSGIYSPDEDGHLDFDDREHAEQRMREGLKKGKISFTLMGQKLRGSWTLVKSKRSENEWLLIKRQDEYARADVDIREEDASVATGQTIDDLKGQTAPATWETRPVGTSAATAVAEAPTSSPMPDASDVEGARRGPMPTNLSPMLPTLAAKAFSHPDWIFEPKLDGVRVLAVIGDGDVRLISRRGNSIASQYPGVAAELSRRVTGPAILDGEIVALDEEGRPSFHRLAHRMHLANPMDIRRAETQIPVVYYVFDLIYLGEYDLRATPLELRKELLQELITPSQRIALLDHYSEVGELAYEAVLDHGLEGIVAKKRRSTYELGRRSRQWLKVKGTTTEDFVVGGYSQGTGNRESTFGALLVGSYDDEGKLRYAANVGTGFDRAMLADLLRRLEALKTDESPFVERPPIKGPVTWVRPEMVVELKFAQHTPDGSLRAPVFQRIRDDKPPSDAQEQKPVPPPAGVAKNGRSAHAPSEDAPRLEEIDRSLDRLEHVLVEPDPAPSLSHVGNGTSPSLALPLKGGGDHMRDGGEPQTADDVEVQLILEQLSDKRKNMILEVQGEKIALTNLDKVFWPDAEGGPITKRDFIRYLATVSPHLMPHLEDRPLTLIRFPNGAGGQKFFQKHAEDRPDFVQMVRYFSKHNAGDQDYLLCNNLPTLMWLGQIAALELHVSYSRTNPAPDAFGIPESAEGSTAGFHSSILNYPDFLVFDIDPYIYSGKENPGDEPELNELAFKKTCEAALWIKETLDSLKLRSFVKTTGRTGLHIFVPIVREFTYETVRATSETIALHVLRQHPKELTTEWQVSKRPGKVFIDYNQGARGKTLAAIYSPRAALHASVSTPLRWEEMGEVYPTDFTIRTIPARLAQVGDLWADILDAKQDLKAVLGA